MEVQLPGAVRVGRNAEVAAITQIGANFEGVVAVDHGPVVDDLELVFALGQRAVAAVDVQAAANVATFPPPGLLISNPGAPEVK